MKRSSCLPALLLGLTLTSVFASRLASAAPEGGPAGVRVAQALHRTAGNVAQQPSDPQPEDGQTNPPAPPTGTTAPTVSEPGSEPQPAVSIGTTIGGPSAPATDTAQAGAEDGKKKPKARPWAGTQVFLTTSMTTATVFQGQTQYADPTVEGSVWLLPRYTINKDFQLRGRLIVSYEMTNSDDTKYRNEPVLSDAGLQLFYRSLPEFAKIKPMVSFNLGLPTSKLSRARTLVASTGLGLQLVRAFEHVLGGEIDVIGGVTYTHPFYRYTTSETLDPTPYAFQCFGGNSCTDQLSGTFNPANSLGYNVIISGEWGKWSPALFYSGGSQWAYGGKEDLTFQGRPVQTVDSTGQQSPNAVRQSSYFSAWVDYSANSWLTAEVGYWLSRSMLAADGKYGNPFFDRYNDMRVYAGVNFNIDNLMKALEGEGGEAGVIRAQTTKKPMLAF
jgi:hypothetical protein